MPVIKYYDKYTTSNANTACNGSECLSHALSETNGWYNDVSNMINETESWMTRGGVINGANNGIFYYSDSNTNGGIALSYSFRLVATLGGSS